MEATIMEKTSRGPIRGINIPEVLWRIRRGIRPWRMQGTRIVPRIVTSVLRISDSYIQQFVSAQLFFEPPIGG
jgi:hypothetical protein